MATGSDRQYIDRIEEKLWGILKRDSKSDKEQEMYNLLQSLNLPIHSGGDYTRLLNYPDMFEHVTEWIRERRAERRERTMTRAVWVAGLSALASALCALFALLRS